MAKKHTDEFIALVKQAAAEDLHMSAIARKLGVTPSVIKYAVDVYRIKVKRVAPGRGRVSGPRPAYCNPISPLRELAAAEFNSGDSATVVAARLGVTRNAVLGQWNRSGLLKKQGTINELSESILVDPPSLAMIRLAAHDPIIARALRQRSGEPFEPIDTRPYNLGPNGFTKKRGGA